MGFKIVPTELFSKELKRIAKKHKAILDDIAELSKELKKNPRIGTDLGHNVYKIRMAISGTGKGKSGGARVITCVILVKETVYLSDIYLKSEYDTVNTDTVIQRLKDNGLI